MLVRLHRNPQIIARGISIRLLREALHPVCTFVRKVYVWLHGPTHRVIRQEVMAAALPAPAAPVVTQEAVSAWATPSVPKVSHSTATKQNWTRAVSVLPTYISTNTLHVRGVKAGPKGEAAVA